MSRQKDEETIREVVQRDPLAEISYQEKEILWKQRYIEVCRVKSQILRIFNLPNFRKKKKGMKKHVVNCYRILQRILHVSSPFFAKAAAGHEME